ncbi:MAG: hypothetical protein IT463_02225, partial [Planctomycetes bacterium]|nr:hypothetical protein [Planctomycetota bacterium]
MNEADAPLHAHLARPAGDHSKDAYRPRPGQVLDRFERGAHADPEDLAAGRVTPDGRAVPPGKQRIQAEINRRWLEEERERLQASRGNPVAYAQGSHGEAGFGINPDELDRFLRSQDRAGNAAEGDLSAKAAAAQEYAARLAAEYYARLGAPGNAAPESPAPSPEPRAATPD